MSWHLTIDGRRPSAQHRWMDADADGLVDYVAEGAVRWLRRHSERRGGPTGRRRTYGIHAPATTRAEGAQTYEVARVTAVDTGDIRVMVEAAVVQPLDRRQPWGTRGDALRDALVLAIRRAGGLP